MAAVQTYSPFRESDRPLDGTVNEGDPHLQLLGRFDLHLDGRWVRCADAAKRLLVLLALDDTRKTRSLVAGTLWPEKSESRAVANLRSTLWRLPECGAGGLVDSTDHTLALASHVRVDVREFQRQGWSLVEERVEDLDAIDASLFHRNLLPGWYDDWVILERERLAQLQIHFLEALCARLSSDGRHAAAVDSGIRLVALDPLRAGSQRVLIQAYLAEGSYAQADRQLTRYEEDLRSTLGCELPVRFRDIVPWSR